MHRKSSPPYYKGLHCTKTLIAPKNSNDEFKQVHVQNNKKNVVRTAVVQDAAGSHQCNECGYKKYIGHFKQHRK